MHQGRDIIFRDRAIIKLDSVDSTNNYAATLLRQSKPPEGTAIIALEQTHGRGQRGNLWESEVGANLLCSIILYPDFLNGENYFYLSKCASLALADVVNEITGLEVRVKWPNDIVANGKKLGGVLIESSWSENRLLCSIVGVGLNLNQQEFSISYASSLRSLTKKFFEPESVFEKFLKNFSMGYSDLKSGKFAEMDLNYRRALYRLGVTSRFIYEGKQILGMITGVDVSGHLCVYTELGQSLKCELKEIGMVW
ncbi:MAG: biotin--[acetyl-CoA-carboxylase] ligase [Flavobacteriales bacterium]|nr:biotin--[acetyl-CoA-carboxylase] ligase [Flavobacteriales bacterium]